MRSPRSRTGETTCRKYRREQATGQRACAHGGLRLPAATLWSIAPRVAGGRQVPAFPSKDNVNRAFSWPRRSGRQQHLPPPREHRGGRRAHKPPGLCAVVRTVTERTCVVYDEPQPCRVDRSVYRKFNRVMAGAETVMGVLESVASGDYSAASRHAKRKSGRLS